MARLTAQVRKILRETGVAGSYEMWTNKYKNCRTVKCYAPRDNNLIAKAASQIEKLCIANGVKFDMKVIEGRTWYGNRRSVIVRLPRDY